MRKRSIFSFTLLCIGFASYLGFFPACARKPADQPEEVILARICGKTISVNEFIRRAEYTIRPKYCKMDNYVHRKIVLNSLIAEKLLALEAGDDNELTRSQYFQDYLRGRMEQAMRQWQYYHDFYEKVHVNPAEVRKAYGLSRRKYKIAYFTLDDSAAVRKARALLEKGVSFEEVFRQFSGTDELPEREVEWSSVEIEDPRIQEALYTDSLHVGQVVGPVALDNGLYTFMKVLGWTERVLLSDKDQRQRWEDVKTWVRSRHAVHRYREFVRKVMHGKRMEFVEDTFRRLVAILGPAYLKSFQDKKEMFNRRFWHGESNDLVSDDIGTDIQNIMDRPLFRLDGEVWTVADFMRELRIHPLVFRKRLMKASEFPEQLKFAIADMIRDKYVAQEAYKKGYDKVNIVQRNVNMWRDYLVAIYWRNKYLASLGKLDDFRKDEVKVTEEILNPYVDELQRKYSDCIEINTDRFEKIQLTRIDMFVLQRNVPFPIVVPAFPIVTTDHWLDYGRKMEAAD